VIDTLNTTLHGEENSATIVNEYAKLIAPICGQLGAALIVTHHIRKQDSKFPIKTLDDMASSVRGSSALPAAFRVVFGLWHATTFGKVMPALGLEPKAKALWNFGVLKANNPEMMDGIRYMLRNDVGLFDDVTDRADEALTGEDAQREEWLVAAIDEAAEAGVPYRATGKDSQGGMYARRQELHESLRNGARTKLPEMLQELEDDGRIQRVTVDLMRVSGGAKRIEVYDLKGGPFTKPGARVDEGASWTAPDWSQWEFDKATRRVKRKGGHRMTMGAK
jgi:hypothetical protein